MTTRYYVEYKRGGSHDLYFSAPITGAKLVLFRPWTMEYSSRTDLTAIKGVNVFNNVTQMVLRGNYEKHFPVLPKKFVYMIGGHNKYYYGVKKSSIGSLDVMLFEPRDDDTIHSEIIGTIVDRKFSVK